MLPRIAVTLGDPSGIGPEVTAAAVTATRRELIPVVFGDERAWSAGCRAAGVPDRLRRVAPGEAFDHPSLVCVTRLAARDCRPGRPSAGGGRAQLAFLEAATRVLQDEGVQGLCTAPLSKAQARRAGVRGFTGHTEFLAERFKARVLMLLAGPRLRVALHTTHLPLREVAGAIDGRRIVEDLRLLDGSLERWFGIRRPRLAVCGLNPHAGEQGELGDEEQRIIAPAIARARRAGLQVQGPFAADGLFPRAARGEFDAVLAMYHDQGLGPLKLLHFEEAVNVTLGLPRPRTSPDHGVAYDLAGKGVASPGSMIAALELAAAMCR